MKSIIKKLLLAAALYFGYDYIGKLFLAWCFVVVFIVLFVAKASKPDYAAEMAEE